MNGKQYQTDFIEVSGVKCACGCGMEAAQIYKGIPIPETNPMEHYKTYKDRKLQEWIHRVF
jgi:hypothetical protein